MARIDRNLPRILLTVSILSAVSVTPCFGENWTAFLGTTGETITKSIPVAVPLERSWELRPRGYWGFRSAPAVADGVVYAAALDHSLYAVEEKTGKKLWEVRAGERCSYSSPAIGREVVVFGSDDKFVYGVDRVSGGTKWRVKTGHKVEGTPVIADGQVLIGSRDHHIYAIDGADGKVQWKKDLGGAVFARPTVVGDRVYIGSEGFGGAHFYCLNRRSGEQIFKIATSEGIYGAASTDGKNLYFAAMDGVLRAVSAEDGKVVWTYTAPKGIPGSPACGSGLVVFPCQDGVYRAVNKDSGELVWEYSAGKWRPMLSSPVIVGRQVWFPYAYWLVCLGVGDGQKLYEYKFRDLEDDDGPADGPAVAIANGSVYYCTRHGLIRFVTAPGAQPSAVSEEK